MIDFQKFDPAKKDDYNRYLLHCGERGCEYSFANLNMWGKQRGAFVQDRLVLFSQFERRSVYPYPIGQGELGPVLEAIFQDARKRGILCRLTGLTAQDCADLEGLYPGQFRFHPDRNSCDYVYRIDDLADLPGRKYQKKRNHVNKFEQNHPDCQALPMTAELLGAVQEMVDKWYESRLARESQDDFQMERTALRRAFAHMDEYGIEGLVLVENGEILAMTMGSPLSGNTFDVHFEKAREDVDGAYTAINRAFARYLREKYPDLRYLNREDDMGLPGLRKAKLSYYPDHLIVKFWASPVENDDED